MSYAIKENENTWRDTDTLLVSMKCQQFVRNEISAGAQLIEINNESDMIHLADSEAPAVRP